MLTYCAHFFVYDTQCCIKIRATHDREEENKSETMSSTSQEDLSSQGDSKGVDESSKTGQQQRFEDSPTPPQSMILPGYYPAQYAPRQTAYASPEVNYYYHHQQQNFGASATADSSAGESTRDSPVQLSRAFVPQQQHQQTYGGAPGRTYDASSGAAPTGSSIPDSAAPLRRSGEPEGDLGIGGAAGAAAAAASLLYQTSYPGGKVNYNPNYPTMGGPPSPTGYPEGVPRRLPPHQQALYQQAHHLPLLHGLPNTYPSFATAQGSLGYLGAPERHHVSLDDPSISLDSSAPVDALPGHIASTTGSYYRPASNTSAVEAARALGAPAGGSFYPQQPPSWYGMPDPFQQQGLSAAGYSDSPHGAYIPYQGATFPNPGPPIQTTPFNKGPEGANLFVFHIPNDMTNQVMYEMFAPFGNLLSVRIMVEKDTGRSRGFGFVSYDLPECAAAAIQALNGHIVGNKRLKVQHKQIRGHEKYSRKKSSSPSFARMDNIGDSDVMEAPSSLDSMRALISHQTEVSHLQVPKTELEEFSNDNDSDHEEGQVKISESIPDNIPDFVESSRSSPSLADHRGETTFDVSRLRNDLPD